jgi:putative phosphoesterase
VGVISDTHGLLRPEVLPALQGSHLIVHAGDIGDPAILEALRALAPVIAVRGNNDREPWGRRLPETQVVEAGGAHLLVVHDVNTLLVDPREGAQGGRGGRDAVHAVIAGHSHKPRNERKQGVLYFNPGSAGPRRFSLPVTLGRLVIENGRIDAEIVPLLENA